MKYYAYLGSSPSGPYEADGLASRTDFNRETLVQLEDHYEAGNERWLPAGEVPLLSLLMDRRDRVGRPVLSRRFTSAESESQRAALEAARQGFERLAARLEGIESALRALTRAVYGALAVAAAAALLIAARAWFAGRPAAAPPAPTLSARTPQPLSVAAPKPALPPPSLASAPRPVAGPAPVQAAPPPVAVSPKPVPAPKPKAAPPPAAPTQKPAAAARPAAPPAQPSHAPKGGAKPAPAPAPVAKPPAPRPRPVISGPPDAAAVEIVEAYLISPPDLTPCPRTMDEALYGNDGPARTPLETVDCWAWRRFTADLDALSAAKRWSLRKALKELGGVFTAQGGFEAAFPLAASARQRKGNVWAVELGRHDRLSRELSRRYDVTLPGGTLRLRYEADLDTGDVTPITDR